jgi:hypothetical protein
MFARPNFIPAYLRLVLKPELRRFIFGQLILLIAINMALFCLPWFVLGSGGGVLAATFSFLISYVAYIFFSLPTGILGDRLNPRLVLILAGLVGSVCAGILCLATYLSLASLGLILILGFIIGALRPLADATLYATLATQDQDGFILVGTFISFSNVFTRIVAPVVAGLLIVYLGNLFTFALIAVLFGLLILLAWPISEASPVICPEQVWRANISTALRYLVGPARRLVLVNGLWNSCLAGASLALIAPFVASLGGNAAAGSLVVVAGNFAALTCAAIIIRPLRRWGAEKLLRLALPLSAIGIALFSFAPTPLWAAALYVIAYFGIQIWVSANLVAVQSRAPADCHASVATLSRTVAFVGVVLGGLWSGLAVGLVGLRATMLLAAGLVLILSLIFFVTRPKNLDRRSIS